MKDKSRIRLKEKFKSFSKKTTIHAIPNIVSNNPFILKLMWSCCLIASLVYCVNILTLSINDYYEYRVLTRFELIHESSSNFPMITFCNLNQYELTKNQNLTQILDYILNEQNSENIDSKKQIELIKSKFFQMANKSYLNEIRFSLKDMLIDCHFKGIKCNENDFKLETHHEYGNCYSFNSDLNNIKKTSHFGPDCGLRLELFSGNIDYSFNGVSGIILFINDQTNNYYQDDSNVELEPGTHANLALNKVIKNKLPYPYNECVDFKKNNFTTKNSCIDSCSKNYCSNKTNIETCLVESKNICSIKCSNQCETVNYEVASLSYSMYPSLFYEKILAHNSLIKQKNLTNSNDFKLSLVSVNIYFNSDMHEKITEIPETNLANLVGQIGGQFGLFLGISLLSILELIELLLWVLAFLIEKFLYKFFQIPI